MATTVDLNPRKNAPTKSVDKDAERRVAAKPEDVKRKPIDLSKPMQQHILAMALRMPGVYPQIRKQLDPVFFDDDDIADMVAWSNHNWDEHKQVPSQKSLVDVFPKLKSTIAGLWEDELTDPAHTIQRIRDFAHNRAMRLAITKAAYIIGCQGRGETPRDDATNKEIKDDPVTLVKASAIVGREDLDVGVDYHETLEAGIQDILHPQKVETLGTGMEHLDLAGVLLERGEVGCILGAPKAGKSHVLLNVGYGALKTEFNGRGLKVVYYSFEMPEHRIRQRLYRRIVGNAGDMKQDPHKFVELLKKRSEKLIAGRFLLKRFPAYSATMDDLRAHMTTVISQGFVPDVVLCDYPGIMKPIRSTGEVRLDLEQNWLDFRSMVGEFNVYGWGAAQANRAAVNKPVVGMQDMAEAFGISRHIDAGYSICMTEEEKAANEGRFFIFAARNEMDGTLIDFKHDYSRSLVQTTGITRPMAEKRKKDRQSTDQQREEAAFHEARSRKRNAEEKK